MSLINDTDPNDPKGLIREAFLIDGISIYECRSIFVDWALSVQASDHTPLITALLARHSGEAEDHPMKTVLTEGLATKPPKGRRGGRAARVKEG